MNNFDQNLLLPSQARGAKQLTHKNKCLTYNEKYRLAEGVRFELTSPPYLRWRSTTELSSNVIRTAFTGGSYVFTHKNS